MHEANAGAKAAGHGLLYALTGAQDDANKAQELVWVRLRRAVGGPPLTTEAMEVMGVALPMIYAMKHGVRVFAQK